MLKSHPKQIATAKAKLGRKRQSGFTLVEVMLAFSVMVVGVTGALMTLVSGLHSVDNARCDTLAAQIMQSQIENLRLSNWKSITERTPSLLQDDVNIPLVTTDPAHPGLLPLSAAGVAQRFTLKQSISRDTDPTRQDMLNIKLVVTWTGHGNIPHTRTFVTRYCQEGIYNYYATGR